MIVIASHWFNVERMRFPWRQTLANWVDFLATGPAQIVIAVNTSDDNTATLVREHAKTLLDPRHSVTVDVIDIAIPYTDPEFDGRGKAAAIAAAKYPYVMLLDCDERVMPKQRHLWAQLIHELERNRAIDGFYIPVVDLMGDEQHYKGVGTKCYLHRSGPNITRGVWKGGYREDGSINTESSDTCDAIMADTRELIKAAPLLMQGLPHYITMGQLESGQVPLVLHYGYLDQEQRVRQSAFWAPVWTQRRGGTNPEPTVTLESLSKIHRYRHNLPDWTPGR